jgi:hypothetical protein
MKTILIAAGLVVVTSAASAGLPLGRGEVTAQVTATATYDSNVFGTHDATGDFFGTLAPRLMYKRQAGQIEAEANAGISFIRFVDQTQLDANNLDFDATVRLPPADYRHLSGSLSASYVEASQVNTDLNARINTKTATYDGRADVVTGARSNLTLSGNYTDSQRDQGSDQQVLTSEALYSYRDFFYGNSLRLIANYEALQSSGDNSLGVPLDQSVYTFSAGLERAFAHDALRAGFTYGYRVLNRSAAETSTGVTRQSGSVITASLDGPFLPAKYFPKVTSHFALSYQDAATPGINDTGTKELTGSLGLEWQARSTTRVSFNALRSQRLAANDLSVVSTNLQLELVQELRYNLTGSLSAGYDWSDFTTINRQDRTTLASAGLKYHFARVWDATCSYLYSSVKSTLVQSTFDRHLISLGLTRKF